MLSDDRKFLMGRRQVHPLDCRPSTTGRMKSTHIAVNLGNRQQMHCRLQIPSKPREITLIHRRYSLTCMQGRATRKSASSPHAIEKHSCGLQSNSDGRRFFGFYRWLMEALKQIVGEHLTRIHPVMEKNGWDISIHMIFCMFDWPILMGYALSYNKRLGSAMSHHTQRQRGSRLRKSTVVSVTPFILLLRIWLSNGILLIYLMSLHRENDNATSSKTNITQNCWRLWQNTIHIIRFIWRPNSETITSRSHYWGRNSWLLCSSANTCVSAAVTFVACNISSISSECAAVFTTCSSVAILQEIWGTKLMNIIKYVHKYQMMQYNIKVT